MSSLPHVQDTNDIPHFLREALLSLTLRKESEIERNDKGQTTIGCFSLEIHFPRNFLVIDAIKLGQKFLRRFMM